jgi:hypothetical protein
MKDLLSPDLGNPVLNIICVIAAVAFVFFHIYRDIRKEMDIQAGMDAKEARKYNNKIFHRKNARAEYKKARLKKLGMEDDSDISGKEIIKAQANYIAHKKTYSIKDIANKSYNEDEDDE